MAADTIVTAPLIVTGDAAGSVVYDGAVAIEAGRIVAVGPAANLSPHALGADVVSCPGCVVVPGFINTHTHLFQTMMKGLGDDIPLLTWIERLTTPASLALTPRDCYLAAVVGCLDAVCSGTTTLVDFMHTIPAEGMVDETIRGIATVGLRAVLARGVRDRQACEYGVPPVMVEEVPRTLADCDRLRATYERPDGAVRIWLAPASVWATSAATLVTLREYATDRRCGITLHTAETPFDDTVCLQRYGTRTYPFLDRLGLLGPDFLGVHCIHLTREEMSLLADRQVRVSHNPVSNMYLGNGIAPVADMVTAGVVVSLGTDGASSNNSQDMLEVLKAAALGQKAAARDPAALRAPTVFRMATLDGARALGLEREIGSLEVGKYADLVIFDPRRAKSVPVFDPVSTLVYASSPANVRSVMVGGRWLLRDGRFPHLDEEALLDAVQEAAWALAERAGTLSLLRGRTAVRPLPLGPTVV